MSGGMIILIAVLLIMVVGLGMTMYWVIWSVAFTKSEKENTHNEASNISSFSSDSGGGYDGSGYDGGGDSYSSD